jgi:hypothetical protein
MSDNHGSVDRQISAPMPVHMPMLSAIATTYGNGDE